MSTLRANHTIYINLTSDKARMLLTPLPQSGPISNCIDPKRGKLIVSEAWHNPWGNLMYRRGMS